MKEVLHIATREIRERRLVFVAAFVAGWLPILFASRIGSSRVDTINIGALVVAAGFAVGGAILVGATIIGRDLADRRLSFDFTRPVSTLSIWSGRLLAALATIAGTVVLSFVPATLFGHGLIDFWRTPAQWIDPGYVPAIGWAILFIFGVAHIAAIDFRARTWWSVADVVGIPLLLGLGWLVWGPIVAAGAFELSGIALIVLSVLLLIAVFVTSAIGFVRGRIDLADTQRRGSKSLAAIVGGITLFFIVWAVWVRSATPPSLRWTDASPSLDSPFARVGGPTSLRFDYGTTFLFNIDTGEWSRLGGNTYFWAHAYDDNGTTAVFARRVSLRPFELKLFTIDLENGTERDTGISTFETIGSVSISPDSRRIAFVDQATLRVFDLTSGQEAVALRLGTDFSAPGTIIWTGPSRVRAYSGSSKPGPDRINIAEAALDRNMITNIGWAPAFRAIIDSTGERLLPLSRKPGRIELSDARSGEGIATLGTSDSWQSATFLAGGGIAASEVRDGHPFVSIFDRSAAPVREIALGGAAARVLVGGEPVAGKLTVVTSSRSDFRGLADFASAWNVYLIDIDSGTVSKLAERAFPLAVQFWGVRTVGTPGSAATRLLQGSGRRLLVIDNSGSSVSPLID